MGRFAQQHWLWVIISALILASVLFLILEGLPSFLPGKESEHLYFGETDLSLDDLAVQAIQRDLNLNESYLIFQSLCDANAAIGNEPDADAAYLFGDREASLLCKQRLIKYLGLYPTKKNGLSWVILETYVWDLNGNLKEKKSGYLQATYLRYKACYEQTENPDKPKWPCKKNRNGQDSFAALSVDEVLGGQPLVKISPRPEAPTQPVSTPTPKVVALSQPLVATPTSQPSPSPTLVSPTVTGTPVPTPTPQRIAWGFVVVLKIENDPSLQASYEVKSDEVLYRVIANLFNVNPNNGAEGFKVGPHFVKGPKCGFLTVEVEVTYQGPKYEETTLLNSSDEIEVSCEKPKNHLESLAPNTKFVPAGVDVNLRWAPYFCYVRKVFKEGDYQDYDCEEVGKKDRTVAGTLNPKATYFCPEITQGSYHPYYQSDVWCLVADQWGAYMNLYVLGKLLVAVTPTPVVRYVPVVTRVPVVVTTTPLPSPTPEPTQTVVSPEPSLTPQFTSTPEFTPTPEAPSLTPTQDIPATLTYMATVLEARKTTTPTPTN